MWQHEGYTYPTTDHRHDHGVSTVGSTVRVHRWIVHCAPAPNLGTSIVGSSIVLPRLISARPSLDHPSLLPTRDRGASVVGFDERCTQSSRRGAKAREARKAKKAKRIKEAISGSAKRKCKFLKILKQIVAYMRELEHISNSGDSRKLVQFFFSEN
jgi:hypothetical protein